MRRGQFVIIALSGDYGKPRPALVVQSDLFALLASVTVCPLTTNNLAPESEVRLAMSPTQENGLHQLSQVMIDKITSLPAHKVGKVIGTADAALMARVTRALALFLGFV